MPNWTAFAGGTIAVLVVLLILSHLTQSAFEETTDSAEATDRSDFSTDSSDDGEEFVGEPIERETPSSGVHDDRTAADRLTDTGEDRTRPNALGTEDGSSSSADDRPTAGRRSEASRGDAESSRGSAESSRERAEPSQAESPRGEPPATESTPSDPSELSTGMLLANVALSQGLFAVVLVGAAIYTDIPLEALGLEISRSWLFAGLALGTGFGIALYVGNEIAAAVSTWVGFEHDEDLRDMLGPDSIADWIALLAFVLPIIAVFEELLFRAALIGVFEAGFDISPWLLAVVSSIAFGLGHGMQGSVGILVTGALGFALAAAFVLTGNLLVVVVAHYLINALEFVVHEGLDFEWAAVLERGG
ncbi:CPBP family glutamic-type intramembrane protease [Halostagnicola kamekurae]|uniref:Membrane protease YdiL, CAAX protease family n=1 Tax=Halostagnicola kamekurae TaxID=619731 RepID=A0A1I6RWM3_9EURY|nr:CPBP family glutamic-type intramembrane protease [Halostagnicola kamekurae]SFS69076.1 Membrane protease YdiL, CAAX protease family [Halostagnicola kamekurae]